MEEWRTGGRGEVGHEDFERLVSVTGGGGFDLDIDRGEVGVAGITSSAGGGRLGGCVGVAVPVTIGVDIAVGGRDF